MPKDLPAGLAIWATAPHPPPPCHQDTVMRGWVEQRVRALGWFVTWPPSADHPALRSLRLREGLPNKRVTVAS